MAIRTVAKLANGQKAPGTVGAKHTTYPDGKTVVGDFGKSVRHTDGFWSILLHKSEPVFSDRL